MICNHFILILGVKPFFYSMLMTFETSRYLIDQISSVHLIVIGSNENVGSTEKISFQVKTKDFYAYYVADISSFEIPMKQISMVI